MLKLIPNLFYLATALTAKAKSEALFDQALTLNEAGNYKEAFPLMKNVAEAGNVRAMSLLGSMYLMGKGVPENGNEAERWLKRAADEGYLDAASVLGMAYATGKSGIKRNVRLAKELLMRAASSGDQKAKQMLEAIERRQGVFRNLK
jgi:hypothetical protein